jgi:hypothetical protein
MQALCAPKLLQCRRWWRRAGRLTRGAPGALDVADIAVRLPLGWWPEDLVWVGCPRPARTPVAGTTPGGLAATHRATTADAPRCATRITSTQPWVPTATPRVSPGRSTLAGELPESFLRT